MNGFTLVEVVVALLVVQLGVLAASSTVLVATRTLRHAQDLERAVAVAGWLSDSLPDVVRADSVRSGAYHARWSPGSAGVRIEVIVGSAHVHIATAGEGRP